MELINKTFEELTTKELYELLKLRSEIFVVEQNCVYQDIDDLDYTSRHLFLQDEAGVVHAYLRLYYKKDEPETVQVGRVVTKNHGLGHGGRLLHEGVCYAREHMGAQGLYIHAQRYAAGYYAREGFAICSDEFLEDGIPHVEMRVRW